MTPLMQAGLLFALMLALMAVRVPIAIAMFIAGAVGYVEQAGWGPLAAFLNTQAFARFGPSPVQVVPSKDGARAMGELPVAALPVSMEIASWFSRLGIISVADLAQLPRAASAARQAMRARSRP